MPRIFTASAPAFAAAVLAGLLCTSGAAVAQTSSLSLTCAEAAGLIQARGVAVLATSRTLYDRYVRDRRFCYYEQDTKPEWVPTRDNPQCFIGYTCFDPSRGGGRVP
ncbi:hypothetical protein ABLE93_16800 [Xanthobacter sp. KR7-65]|uniref:hypothetical protein n=1 Tax=Xanthobacter sp. KR7-65 TaxID=3156612 RepID=UPI0032B6088F